MCTSNFVLTTSIACITINRGRWREGERSLERVRKWYNVFRWWMPNVYFCVVRVRPSVAHAFACKSLKTMWEYNGWKVHCIFSCMCECMIIFIYKVHLVSNVQLFNALIWPFFLYKFDIDTTTGFPFFFIRFRIKTVFLKWKIAHFIFPRLMFLPFFYWNLIFIVFVIRRPSSI